MKMQKFAEAITAAVAEFSSECEFILLLTQRPVSLFEKAPSVRLVTMVANVSPDELRGIITECLEQLNADADAAGKKDTLQ